MTAPAPAPAVDDLRAALNDPAVIERFWPKVDTSSGAAGCWEWTAARTRRGYGTFSINRRMYGAHRVAYALEYGPIPEGLVVRHRCDNPVCCRIEHLELGTSADNSRDMVERGRCRPLRGHAAPGAVLTEAQVSEFRARVRAGETIASVVQGLGLPYNTIRKAVRGETWRGPVLGVHPVPVN